MAIEKDKEIKHSHPLEAHSFASILPGLTIQTVERDGTKAHDLMDGGVVIR